MIHMNASISPQLQHHRVRDAVCCSIPERSLMKWDGMDNVPRSTLKNSALIRTLMMVVIDANGSRLMMIRIVPCCGQRHRQLMLLNLDAVQQHLHGQSTYVPQRLMILDANE